MADYRVTWDKKKENELIDFFEAHPCLWDHTHIDYFRRDVRDALMKELSNRLGCDRSGQIYTETHIKRRWKNIRTTYARECRKSESKSDTNPDNQYVSKWAFIDRLGFVKDFIKARAPNTYNSFNSNLSSSMADQSENFQTLSDDDIDKEEGEEEDEDDDLVVCLSESFKENHSTQKSDPSIWENEDKKNQNIWISENASLLNTHSDLKTVDNGNTTTTAASETTWIVQEKIGSQNEWRLKEQRNNSLEMWKKGFKPIGQRQIEHIEISENKHDSGNSINSIGHITYIRDLKGTHSEKASPNQEYQQAEVISITEPYSNEKVSWNKEKESELISFFESNQFLWDHSHPDYFNRDLRDCMIKELSSKLGKDQNGQSYSEIFIKQKWKNLRTTYARELKKIERYKIHYHEAPYVSRWAHTERLSFLKDCLKIRGQSRNISHLQNNADVYQAYSLSDDSDGDNDSVTWSSEPFTEDTLTINEPISLRNNSNNKNKIESDNATRSSETYTDVNYGNSPQYAMDGIKKRRYLEDQDPKEDLFKEALKMLNLKTCHDPEDLFGMHVAGTLRRMQPLQREKAKLDIQSILLQYCFSETN